MAYRSQLGERRRRVHAEVARALEDLEAERLDVTAAELAHHYEEAGEALDAARWHERAAQWTERSDLAEALLHWEAVRRLAGGLVESPEIAALGVAACRKILAIGWRRGATEAEGERILAEGRALAERAGDLRSLAILIGNYGILLCTAGRVDEYVEKCFEALRIAEESGDRDLQCAIATLVLYSHTVSGRIREGVALCESGLGEIPEGRNIGPEVTGYYPDAGRCFARSWLLLYAGRACESLAERVRAERLALEHDDPVSLSVINSGATYITEIVGSDVPVLAHARRALEISEPIGDAFGVNFAWVAIGIGHSLVGQWHEARAALDRALTLMREQRTALYVEAHTLTHLARVELCLGEVERARCTIGAAVRAGQKHRTRLWEIQAHIERARILREIDRSDGIEEAILSLCAAERLVEETGAESFRPQVHEERGRLAALRGDSAAHDRELVEAHRLYVAIGADGHAARLAKEIAVL